MPTLDDIDRFLTKALERKNKGKTTKPDILESVDEVKQNRQKQVQDKLHKIYGHRIEGKIDEIRILLYGIDSLNLGLCDKFDTSKLHLHPAIIDQISEENDIQIHRIIRDGKPFIDYIYK